MNSFVSIHSKVYIDDDTWSARPSYKLIQTLHSGEGSARWIAVIQGKHIALGDPIQSEGRDLYVPQWFLEYAGIDGGAMNVQFERSESFVKAQRLCLKIIGDIPEGIDIKELLEEPLSQLGVLEEGQVIPAPIFEGIHLLVDKCEPDAIVFLDGAEIALELEEEESHKPTFVPFGDDDAPMLPVASKPGRRLCD